MDAVDQDSGGDSSPSDPIHGLLAELVDGLDPCRGVRANVGAIAALEPATRLGAYEIIAFIGAGGMGAVYRARDTRLGREVAIKVLPGARLTTERPRDDADIDSLAETHVVSEVIADAQLLNEAQALARLSHPNVVTVYDVGRVRQGAFIAMELVEGSNLRRWLRARRRSWREIRRVLVDAGRGLAAAHSAGLVHRDLKPENILIGTDDRVRVADFGLALSISKDSGSSEPPRSGVMLGTPGYMAPEQMLGLATDPRTDQFAFCVTALEALYGEGPRGADAAPCCTEAPARLRPILERGLRRDPAQRYASLRALLVELEREPKRWGRRLAPIVATATLVAVLVAWGVRRGEGEPDREAAEHARTAARPIPTPAPPPRVVEPPAQRDEPARPAIAREAPPAPPTPAPIVTRERRRTQPATVAKPAPAVAPTPPEPPPPTPPMVAPAETPDEGAVVDPLNTPRLLHRK
jgi:hypothetical protein